jgi:transcriptional repressor NrdR
MRPFFGERVEQAVAESADHGFDYPAHSMRCPFCTSEDTRVIDSRPAEEGLAIRRRRACATCGQRFTTFERPVVVMTVAKRDGTRQPFDSNKVRSGIERALADQPVAEEAVDDLVRRVESYVRSSSEVTTDDVGREVLDGLLALDEVAYLRFASVYKDFQGAGDFEREAAALERDS